MATLPLFMRKAEQKYHLLVMATCCWSELNFSKML